MFLMAFRVQEMAVGSDTGSETVSGQVFAIINFLSLGFICEYSQKKLHQLYGTCIGFSS